MGKEGEESAKEKRKKKKEQKKRNRWAPKMGEGRSSVPDRPVLWSNHTAVPVPRVVATNRDHGPRCSH